MTIQEELASLRIQVAEHRSIIDRMGQDVHAHDQQLQPARRAPLLNRQEADQLFGPESMRRNLGVGGAAPLNLTGLKGVAAEIQPAKIPEVPQLPQLGDASVKLGTVLKAGGITYRRGPNSWEPIAAPASSVNIGGTQTGAATAADAQPGQGTGALVGTIQDTHANRVNYPAANYPLGTEFSETDRQLRYIVRTVAGVNAWVFDVGIGWGTHAARWADLGTNDAGAEYIDLG